LIIVAAVYDRRTALIERRYSKRRHYQALRGRSARTSQKGKMQNAKGKSENKCAQNFLQKTRQLRHGSEKV
jgi:hypothetical protein